MASRYTSYDSRSSTSSLFSDPSSSTEFSAAKLKLAAAHNTSASRALVKAKHSDLSAATKAAKSNHHNIATMVKKFMEKKSSMLPKKAGAAGGLVVPCDLIAEDLKRTARKGTNFTGLQKKLFGKVSEEKKQQQKKEVKALTEVKGNTRTLAMVLRSERELLSLDKDQEKEISQLKSMLQERSIEVEKLKDLCLKQREEMKALKDAILFPDVMNSQLQELLENQGSEMKQAKQVLPTLQKQVTSLTGQLQCLAEDLNEVKAEKYTSRERMRLNSSSPRTPTYDHEDAANSLEFSSGDPTSPGSTEDLFLNDLNPCLTPYSVKKISEEFDNGSLMMKNMQCNEFVYTSHLKKSSKSSDCCQSSDPGSKMARASRRSDERKSTYAKKMNHRLL
ncbi:hypothetical protein HS088_TW21G00675 [Tripterygium wilfordii]|uniref:Uncharacterized protein n=1 Tax=Tripterygium wilfordii TaxID=458696 RepID=A0A7J7C3V2_TRIWF|nr:uncharacterized protein LOC119990174 [Tripterygium wilfordii]KAF5728527.1 hypothetical protein HS088_TW21G00675 [Tripterygium wilfordii]